jgi:hypothetical protein
LKVVKITGGPARVYSPGGRGHGLGPRYRRPSTTCARARAVRVFLHALALLNLRTASRNGGSLSDFPLLSTPSAVFEQHFLHGDFRIMLSFMFFHLLLATFPHGDFWDPARCCVGWYTVPLVCFLICSFFLANFLFCSQVTTHCLSC